MLDWHKSFQLSYSGLAVIMSMLRYEVQYEGLTGKQALQSLKNSRPYVANMHSAGTLTASAASNIVKLNIEMAKR